MSLPTIVFVVLLLGTGLMRLVEVVVSRRRIASDPSRLHEEPLLFPAMASLHGALIFLPLVEVFGRGRGWDPYSFGFFLGVFVLAGALRYWALGTLGRSWNVAVVDPQHIVTDGPYAYIRHPNYLVVILEILALPMLHHAYLSAIFLTVFNAIVLFIRIRTEESVLAKNPNWTKAMEHRKRLIPGVF